MLEVTELICGAEDLATVGQEIGAASDDNDRPTNTHYPEDGN